MATQFVRKLQAMNAAGRWLCVGLDLGLNQIADHLPDDLRQIADLDVPDRHPQFLLGKLLVDLLGGRAACFKPNAAYFESGGYRSMRALEMLFEYIWQHSTAPTIYDCKRGDIGPTSLHYGLAAFDVMGADAATISPYLGFEGVQPMIEHYPYRTFFPTVVTSNRGSEELQRLGVVSAVGAVARRKLYERLAQDIVEFWGDNVGAVTGATHPDDVKTVRRILGPNRPLLMPGFGSQGANVPAAIKAAWPGLFVPSASSSITFPKIQPGQSYPDAVLAAFDAQEKEIIDALAPLR